MHFHNDKFYAEDVAWQPKVWNRGSLYCAKEKWSPREIPSHRSHKKHVSVLETCVRALSTHITSQEFGSYLSLSGHIRTVGSRPGGCSRITYTLFKRKKLRLKWRELKREQREVRAKLCQSRKTCGFRSMASMEPRDFNPAFMCRFHIHSYEWRIDTG